MLADIEAMLVLRDVEGSLPCRRKPDVGGRIAHWTGLSPTVLLAILTHDDMSGILTMLRMWPLRSCYRRFNVVECVVGVSVEAKAWKAAGDIPHPMPGPSLPTDYLRLEHQTDIYDSSKCPITERGSCVRGCPAATGSATSCRY